jgi:UDP-N-acetyl-D-glucosamine dehydrogenase
MNKSFKLLKKKIKDKDAKIIIFGLGYVGLKLFLQLKKNKYHVKGLDTDKDKIKLLRKLKSPISYIKNKEIKKNFDKNSLVDNLSTLVSFDIIILCLPTPLTKRNRPDLSAIKNCMKNIQKYLKKNQFLILESTSYPGTTKEIIKPFIDKRKLKIGEDFFLGYSPERDDPGSKFEFSKITKICSGITKNCKTLCSLFYSKIVDKTIIAESTDYAEFSKLYENIYRSINIGFVNEMKIISKKMGYNIYEIIRLAKSKPYGFKAFYPGPGVGGHCIPIDPYYLSWKAGKFGIKTKFIELAGKVNIETTNWIYRSITKKINKKSKILLLGIAYKKNINDHRESAGMKLFQKFIEQKYDIKYSDKFISKVTFNINKKDRVIKSIDFNKNSINKYDCVIIATDHDYFDYKMILNSKKIIYDTRGRFKKISSPNIFNL